MEVRRTPAGNAELATPSHGLSLAQRRFLTLLDPPASVAEVARRHALDPVRLDRDAARLRLAGLIEDVAPAPVAAAVSAPVRLGSPPLARRLLLALVPVAAGVLAWAAWQHLAPAAGTDSTRVRRTATVPVATNGKISAPAPAEPVPIATRVLRSTAPERTKEPPVPGKAPEPAASARVEIGAAHAPVPEPSRASATAPPDTLPAPTIRARSSEHEPPAPPVDEAKPVPDATPRDTSTATEPKPIAPAEARRPEPARATPPLPPADAHPPEQTPGPDARLAPNPALQIATLSPAPASLRTPALAPSKLTPIARETPGFPREAIAQGLTSGNVTARITVDAQGRVASVDVLEASHRAFERTVRDTLARWQFEAGAAGRTTTVDVAFKRD